MRQENLDRIAQALEKIAQRFSRPVVKDGAFDEADAFLWSKEGVLAVPAVSRVSIGMLKGIDAVKNILLENTLRFTGGKTANDALLWGARGMGKSSLVKAVHAEANKKGSLALVEIMREDLADLPELMAAIRKSSRRFLIFCDDLSFAAEEEGYKRLKVALSGGIIGKPENALFYATSNRSHLVDRKAVENESRDAINPLEAVDEKISLSDRFGLWLGFYPCSQKDYHDMVLAYAKEAGVKEQEKEILRLADEWAVTRGARSGRVAWQFVTGATFN